MVTWVTNKKDVGKKKLWVKLPSPPPKAYGFWESNGL